MTDDVYDILQRRSLTSGEWFFPGGDKSKPLSAHYKAFISACKRAGIPYGQRKGLIFNDARRTAENYMLESGYHARIVGDILGHSPETMARHYARSTADSRREAVDALKNFGRILAADAGQDGRKRQDGQGGEGTKKPKKPKKAA